MNFAPATRYGRIYQPAAAAFFEISAPTATRRNKRSNPNEPAYDFFVSPGNFQFSFPRQPP